MAAAAKAKESPPVQILRLRMRIKPSKVRKRNEEAASAVVDVGHLRWKID